MPIRRYQTLAIKLAHRLESAEKGSVSDFGHFTFYDRLKNVHFRKKLLWYIKFEIEKFKTSFPQLKSKNHKIKQIQC